LHRPIEGAINKTKRKEIQHHADDAPHTIFRASEAACMMRNRDFANSGSLPSGVNWDEAMHFTVEAYVFDHLPTISFEGAAIIVKMNTQQFGNKPIGGL